MNKTIKYLATCTLVGLLGFEFSACNQQSPLQPADFAAGSSDPGLLAKSEGGSPAAFNKSDQINNAYPQSVAQEIRSINRSGKYLGGQLMLANGSSFSFDAGALTPPAGYRAGQSVTITMLAERDQATGDLVFTFGPSGSSFDPPAELWLSWKDLGAGPVKLYYLNNDGSRSEQTPDDIDVVGQRLLLRIHHFSRYAIAHSQ